MGRFNNLADQIRNEENKVDAHEERKSPIFKDVADEDFFKEQPSKNTIDIIPFIVTSDTHTERLSERGRNHIIPKGNVWYRRQLLIHYNVGPEGHTCICPRTVNKKCPICEYAFEQYREDNDKDTLRKLMPSTRELYNVQDCNEEDPVTKLWLISYGNFGKLFDQMKTVDAENLKFANLEDGKSLEVIFNEEELKFTKTKQKYLKAIQVGFKDRDYDISEEVAEEAFDLNEILIIHDFKTINNMFFGDGDVPEVPTSTTTKASVDNSVEKSLADAGLGPACPHGHEYATADQHDECVECEQWKTCKEASEEPETTEKPTETPPEPKEEEQADTNTPRRRKRVKRA